MSEWCERTSERRSEWPSTLPRRFHRHSTHCALFAKVGDSIDGTGNVAETASVRRWNGNLVHLPARERSVNYRRRVVWVLQKWPLQLFSVVDNGKNIADWVHIRVCDLNQKCKKGWKWRKSIANLQYVKSQHATGCKHIAAFFTYLWLLSRFQEL